MNKKLRTKSRFFRLFFATQFVVCGLVSGQAQVTDFEDYRLNAKMAKGSDISGLDLIRKVFPDAQIEKDEPERAIASQTVKLRNLFGGNEKNFDDKLSLAITDRMETLDGSTKVLWLLINVSHPDKPRCEECSEKILAAFRLSKTEAELIDAANVLTSFDVEFDPELRKLKFAPDREAVILWNFSNVSLTGDVFSIVTADQNGFKTLLDQFDVARNYSCDRWYEETVQLKLLKKSVKGFRGFEILVKTEGGKGWYDFPKVRARQRFRYIFAWQEREQKYRPVVNPQSRRRSFLKRLEPRCPDNQAVPISPA